MNKIISLFTLLLVVAYVTAYPWNYRLEVVIGPQQSKFNTTVDVMLHNKHRLNNYKLNATLTANANYSMKVDYPYQIGQITNVTLLFGAAHSNFNSMVYLKQVRVVPIYYSPGNFEKFIRNYCPTSNSALPVNTELQLKRC